jgi:type IV secretion system protein VirB5
VSDLKTPAAGENRLADNPYLNARREWNERYGDFVARERHWQRLAFLSVAVALVAVGGLAYAAMQNKYVPYVVEIDKLGRLQAVRPATRARPVETRFQKALLAEFIESLRSVVVDGQVQRQRIFKAYAMLRQGDAATAVVSAHVRDHSPFERAKTETVSVQMETLLPLSAHTWRLEWREMARDRTGVPTRTQRWTATATVVIVPPSDEASMLKNPAGLYVTDLSWSRRMEAAG